jgi:glycosyltransferase involved in cell wall biosynthesis
MKIAIVATDNREHLKDYTAPTPYFGTAPAALLQGFTETSDVEIHVVSCTQKPMRSPSKLADNIWFHSLHVPKLGWMRTGYQGCIRAIRSRLKSINPHIVHGQGTERECSISAVHSGFPNVITLHGNMRLIAKVNQAKPFSYMWLAAKLERYVLPRTCGVVCISEYTERAVGDLASQTWVIPNAVDTSFFDVEPSGCTGNIILCVGHVIFRKNQNAFIHAVDSLAKQSELKLVFLGGVSSADSYGRNFLKLIETRPWCEYAGFADRPTLQKWFSKARLVAMPSLEENCPMVLLEAMTAGIPVVAANVGGIPEIVEHNVTGLLFDPTDADSIRTAIAQALQESETTNAMAAMAARRARERYAPSVIASQHVRLYDKLLSFGRKIE